MLLFVVNMSVTASVIGGVLVAVRAILKTRLPRWVFYLAWVAVLVRMLMPFSIPSPFSLFNMLPAAPPVSFQEAGGQGTMAFVERFDRTVEFPTLQTAGENPADGKTSAPDMAVIARSPVALTTILTTVWLCGTAFLILYSLLCFAHTVWRLRRAEPLALEDDSAARAFALTGVDRRRVRARRSDLFTGPVVCGLFRPILVLPWGMHNGELYHVMAHELTHVRRGDNLWKAVATLALYIHWFNPLAWLFYSLYVTDMEASCDEAVVRRGYAEPRAYATCLLQMAVKSNSAFTGGFLAFGESALKERVKSIMHVRKSTVMLTVLCFATLTGLGIIFLTNPQQQMESLIQQNAAGSSSAVTSGDLVKRALLGLEAEQVFNLSVDQSGQTNESVPSWTVGEEEFPELIRCLWELPLSHPLEGAPLVTGAQGHRDLSLYANFKDSTGLRVRLLDTYLEVQGNIGGMASDVIYHYSLTDRESALLLDRIQSSREKGLDASSADGTSLEGPTEDNASAGAAWESSSSAASAIFPGNALEEPGKIPEKPGEAGEGEGLLLEENPDSLRLDPLSVESALLIDKVGHLATGLSSDEVGEAVKLLNAIPAQKNLRMDPVPGPLPVVQLTMMDGTVYEYWLHENVLMLGYDRRLASGEAISPVNQWARNLLEKKRTEGVLGAEWFAAMDPSRITAMRLYNGTRGVVTSTGEVGGGMGTYSAEASNEDQRAISRIFGLLRGLPVAAQEPPERTGDPSIRTRERHELERTIFLELDGGRRKCNIYLFRDGSMQVEASWEQFFTAYTVPDTSTKQDLLERIQAYSTDMV